MIQLLRHLRIFIHSLGHGADGVQHGRVVAAAEVAADLFQAVAGVPAGEEHADLAGEGDATCAASCSAGR